MRYGIPYQGSKNSIALEIVRFLPAAGTLIDILAGGCAITHAALELCEGIAPKWERIISNDINPMPGKLFRDAIDGKYAHETRWISREDFHRLKESDQYVAYCWSFSNNACNYLYSEEIEPWKRAVHYARVLGDREPLRAFGIESDGSRTDIKAHEQEYKEKYIRWWLSQQAYTAAGLDALIKQTREDVKRTQDELRAYLLEALRKSGLTQAEVQRRLGTQMAGHYFGRSHWEFPTREMYGRMQTFMPLETSYDEIVGLYKLQKSLGSLESLQRLERLQSLESLQRLERLQSLERLQKNPELHRLTQTVASFECLQIPNDSVVYADIPYENTDCGSYEGFDHQAFFDWAARQRVPVFISSYQIDDPRFVCVWEREKRCLLQAGGGGALRTERIYTQRGASA